MPSDDVVWAGIVLTGVVILLSYYVVVWARGVRKQLQRLNDAAGLLQARWLEMENDVGSLTRQMAVSVSGSELERYVAAFSVSARFVKSSKPKPKSKMVMRRG